MVKIVGPSPVPVAVPSPIILRAEEAGAIERAAAALGAGGLVVFPTETYYGLAARADDDAGVAALAEIKDRPDGQPLPIVAASLDVAETWATIDERLHPLATALWPGPLTLALPPRVRVPDALLGSGGTLGLRVSSHPVARALAEAAGGVITATSANLRGEPPPVDVASLEAALASRVAIILDDGETVGGAASTVVGIEDGAVAVLREGATSRDAIAHVLGYPPA